LKEEFVPQLGWEISICGADPGNEVVFEGLDGSFCGIDTVLVRGYKLPFDVLLGKVLCDGTFCGKVGENVVECLDDGGGFAVRNGSDNDGIGGVVLGNKDVVFVFQ
jgi:hypothetical protein